MSGLEPTGFSIKRLEDVKLDYESEIEDIFGPVNKEPASNFGQLIGLLSRSDANLWEILQAVYASQYRSSASGVSLNGVGELTGANRLEPLKSTVTAQVTGDQGTVLALGKFASTTDSIRFVSLNDVTIDKANATGLLISVDVVADTTLYTITVNGTAIDFTSGGGATATSIIAGLKVEVDGTSEPITGVDNGDDTLSITADNSDLPFVSDVTANLTIDKVTSNMLMESESFGVEIALALTLTVIDTPISGWDSVSNTLDATVGRLAETDTAYRQRQQNSLQISGSATVEAIRSSLVQVAGVTVATVIENDTSSVDGDGRPPHSFEAIVIGGIDLAVATNIFLTKSAGIETFGTETENVTDSQGIVHVINFSRATPIYMWLEITLTKSTEISYPTDGDQQIIDESVLIGSTYQIDNDVIVQQFFSAVYSVPGVIIAVIEIATSATPAGPPGAFSPNNLAIAANEQAEFDSTRITIL